MPPARIGSFVGRRAQVLLPLGLHGRVGDDADQFRQNVQPLFGDLFQQCFW